MFLHDNNTLGYIQLLALLHKIVYIQNVCFQQNTWDIKFHK